MDNNALLVSHTYGTFHSGNLRNDPEHASRRDD
jgi:hypothetical protein